MINSGILGMIGYCLVMVGTAFGIIALVFIPNDMIGVISIFSSLALGSLLVWIAQKIREL